MSRLKITLRLGAPRVQPLTSLGYRYKNFEIRRHSFSRLKKASSPPPAEHKSQVRFADYTSKWDTLVSEEDEALRRRFFATSIWDFIHRYMPPVKRTRWDQGGLLKPDEVYALTAFLLHQNRIIGETEVMDAQGLPQIHMPNRPSDDLRFKDYLP